MAKYYAQVGYTATSETSPGVWTPTIVEKKYYADILRNNRRRDTPTNINDDITISNEISILADPYAIANFHSMQYIKFMGTAWKISNVEVQFPRLILTIGGVYNGETK